MKINRPPLYYLKEFHKANGEPPMRNTWERVAESLEGLQSQIDGVEKIHKQATPRRNERAEISALKKALAGISPGTKERLFDCISVMDSDPHSDTWNESRSDKRNEAEASFEKLKIAVHKRAEALEKEGGTEPVLKCVKADQKKAFLIGGIEIFIQLGFSSIPFTNTDHSESIFVNFLSEALIVEVDLPVSQLDVEAARKKDIDAGFIDEHSNFKYTPDFFKVMRRVFSCAENLKKYVDAQIEYIEITCE